MKKNKKKYDRRVADDTKRKYCLNKWVMTATNEWAEMSIGPVVDYIELNQGTVNLIIHDVISDKKIVCNGAVKTFDKVMFELLVECDPAQRWGILAHDSGVENGIQDMYNKKSFNEDNYLHSANELREIVYNYKES